MSNVQTKPSTMKPQSSNNEGKSTASDRLQEAASDFEVMLDEVSTAVVNYSKRQPRAIAVGIFALGFMIGWKIKPW